MPKQSASGDAAIGDRQRGKLAARALERTASKQHAFLKAFEKLGTIKAACGAAGIGRRTAYDWLEGDEQFAAAFVLARDEAADILEAEARRRGVHGVPEPVYSRGTVVGYVQRYSDACLLALLSAYRPERFKRRAGGQQSDSAGRAIVDVSYDHNLKTTSSE